MNRRCWSRDLQSPSLVVVSGPQVGLERRIPLPEIRAVGDERISLERLIANIELRPPWKRQSIHAIVRRNPESDARANEIGDSW